MVAALPSIGVQTARLEAFTWIFWRCCILFLGVLERLGEKKCRRERGVQDQSAGVSGYKDKGTILPLATVWHFTGFSQNYLRTLKGTNVIFMAFYILGCFFFVIGCVSQCCNRALKSWPQPKWDTNTSINISLHFKCRVESLHLVFPAPSCVSLAATQPFLWLRVHLCSTALGPLSPWYPSVPSLAPLFSSFLTSGSSYLATFKLAEGPWMGPDSLTLPPLPTHLFSIRVIFLSVRKIRVFLAKLNLTFCSQSQAPLLSQSQGFLIPSLSLLSGVVPDFWLIAGTPVWVEMRGFYFPERERKLDWRQLELACWDGTFPALLWELWHNPGFIYWLHITWGIHT